MISIFKKHLSLKKVESKQGQKYGQITIHLSLKCHRIF